MRAVPTTTEGRLMDNKKRAQVLWALLALLFVLITVPKLRRPTEPGSPSTSPAPDLPPDESPETPPDGAPTTPGTPDTSPETPPDGAGDPTVPPDENDQPDGSDTPSPSPWPGEEPTDGPHDGHGHEAPAPAPGGGSSDIIDDILDDYPTPDAVPSWLQPFLDGDGTGADDGGSGSDDPADAVDGYPTVVPDMREDPRSFGELGEAAKNEIEAAAAATAVAPAAFYNELKDPVTSVANDSVQWALDNPGKAAIWTGGAVAGAVLMTADGPLPIGDAAAVTLMGGPIKQFTSAEKAADAAGEDDEADSDSGTDAGGSVGAGEDETAPATPGEGGHTAGPDSPTTAPEEVEESPSTGRQPSNPVADTPDETAPATPDEGGHTAGPGSPTTPPEEVEDDEPDDNRGREAPDDYEEPEPSPDPPADTSPPADDDEDEEYVDGPNDGHGHEVMPGGSWGSF